MALKQVKLVKLADFVLCLITLVPPLSSLVVDSDYTTANPLEVTFVSGSALVDSTSCAQISIIDDDEFEGLHSFSVEVSTVEIESDGTDPLLTIGTLSSAAIYIEDNDSKYFSCSSCESTLLICGLICENQPLPAFQRK